MAQIRQQNNALRSRYAQAAMVQTTAAVNARTACEQLEQLNRKLAAAHAEIRRYQTRLFACERQMNALRMENAELEAACEQARCRAEELELQLNGLPEPPAECLQPAALEPPQEEPAPAEQRAEVPPEAAEPACPEQEEARQAAAGEPPAEPEWQPKTELEHLSVELMNWFDRMMEA